MFRTSNHVLCSLLHDSPNRFTSLRLKGLGLKILNPLLTNRSQLHDWVNQISLKHCCLTINMMTTLRSVILSVMKLKKLAPRLLTMNWSLHFTIMKGRWMTREMIQLHHHHPHSQFLLPLLQSMIWGPQLMIKCLLPLQRLRTFLHLLTDIPPLVILNLLQRVPNNKVLSNELSLSDQSNALLTRLYLVFFVDSPRYLQVS